MNDINGRSYLTVADAQEGIEIEVDADFTCIETGTKRQLQKSGYGGLCFKCEEGDHDLIGQLSDDETYYVGLYQTKIEK